MNDLDVVEGYEVHLDNVAGIFYGCRVASDRIKGYDVHVVPNVGNDASPQLIGAGHEPRITSVPSPQDGHVHVGGSVHSTATCDHGDQSDGIFYPSHRNLPGFESKLF